VDSKLSENGSIAAQLVRARLSGQDVSNTVVPVPPNLASAMQVQALVQVQVAQPVVGWKVATGPDNVPIAAPLLDVYRAASDISLFQKCTIEVELAVVLGKELPKREAGSYNRSDIIDAIESLVLGIEVIGGRFDSATPVPFLSFLADNLGNRAYVVGDKLPLSILDQVDGLTCHVTLDELLLHQAPAAHPAGDPLLPLLAYANGQSDFLGGLRAGQVVTTGSLCGVLPVHTAGLLKAHLDNVGHVSVRFAV
jgi:2-keto-4-pentenoate hydratase